MRGEEIYITYGLACQEKKIRKKKSGIFFSDPEKFFASWSADPKA